MKRCVVEHFPIQNYNIFEIPYEDRKGWMMDFVNTKEYEEYHKNGNKNVKIHEIDFWVEKMEKQYLNFIILKLVVNLMQQIVKVQYGQNNNM